MILCVTFLSGRLFDAISLTVTNRDIVRLDVRLRGDNGSEVIGSQYQGTWD
jgi:hypothetical protein